MALVFFLLLFSGSAFGQQMDSLPENSIDSTTASSTQIDSAILTHSLELANYIPFYLSDTNKVVTYDVQQMNHRESNTVGLFILFFLLALLTYVKTAFGKDLEEMLQSFANRNIAMQFFRTRTEELTFSSFLLQVNFIVVLSLYMHFFLLRHYLTDTLQTAPSIFFLIILFTLFYLIKIITIRVLGEVFEAQEISDEYIFNFSIVCKTLGLTLIPALFIFYVAPEKYFDFIFAVTLLMIFGFIVLFVLRGLSTGYKMMYKSVYHFFLYVCVVEISPIFLLFKLLTKTVV